jgi:DNA-binding PadR family transcriptional regulator
MGREPLPLGELEQLMLLAVLQCGDNAYGVTVQEELARHTTRRIASGAIYMTLDRLEKKGLLTSRLTEPIAERGGRSKRCYKVTKPALAALKHSRRALISLWDGLELAD